MPKKTTTKNETKLKLYLETQNANIKSNCTENKDNSGKAQAAKELLLR